MSSTASSINFNPSNEAIDNIKGTLRSMAERKYHVGQYIYTLPTQTKVIIIFIAFGIIIISYYYLIYKSDRSMNQKTFMTEINDNPPAPWDTKKPYKWYNPNNEDELPKPYIPSSEINELDQTQYTVSFWIYIRGSLQDSDERSDGDWSYRYGEWKHIMHKGEPLDEKGRTKLQSPGFWLSPKMNNINCIIDTQEQKERLMVDDIPMNEWVNISTVLDSYSLSLYMNGRLQRTITLRFNAINTKKYPVYVTNGPQKDGTPVGLGGFAGSMCFLQFYNTPLEPDKIYLIYTYFLKYIKKYNKYHMKNRNVNAPKLLGGVKY